MPNKSPSGIFSGLAKQFRKLAGLLVEKPTNKVDEHVLEHILLYHGLVGSQEENQRKFRDVRADIIDAVNEQNSLNLAIALKLPPLWWDSKLATIFAEMAEGKKAQAIATLLPEDKNGDLDTNHQPLKHEDWRVRANAAIVLAFLQAQEAIPQMVASLNDTADSVKPAFPHIAYALGQLKGSIAKTALTDHLFDQEPWSRVDAARALALFPKQEVALDLAKAMLSHHKLSDYMAVTIGRAIEPVYFLEQSDSVLKEGGLEMVISIIEASQQTYTDDIVVETNVPQSWPFIFERLADNPTAQELRTAYCLAQWLSTNSRKTDLSQQIADCQKSFTKERYGAYLVEQLKKHKNDKEQNQLRHIVALVNALAVVEALPELSELLQVNSPIIDDVIESLGKIGDNKTAISLVRLANDITDMTERRQRAKQAQPVEEKSQQEARIYWCILQALGNLPTEESAQFLLLATDDFAPDKRSQALASLLAIYNQLANKDAVFAQLKTKLIGSLDDPSTQVQTIALSGIGDLNIIEALSGVTKFIDASAMSLRRQCLATLTQLSKNGHKQAVELAVKAKLNSEFDKFKRQRLNEFLQSL